MRRILVVWMMLLFVTAACAAPAGPLGATVTAPPAPASAGVITQSVPAGAAASVSATASDAPPADSADSAVTVCHKTGAATQLFVEDQAGYCLLYPVGFQAEHPLITETVLAGPVLDDGQARAFITVQHAGGLTAAQAAGNLADEVQSALPGFAITRTEIMMGGEPAIVLDHMPGQDINRQVVIVHGDRLYKLMFVPADPAQAAAYTQMDDLYGQVTGSFTFLATGAPPSQASLTPETAALVWEGHTPFGDGDAQVCKRLLVTPDGRAEIGTCDATGTPAAAPVTPGQEWTEIYAHFAPFQVQAADGQMTFRGQGQAAGPAWSRALAVWAQFTYGAVATGRVGAANRTALSWWLGEVSGQPGSCAHLVALVYGYAYANIDPCQGGQNQASVGGWLTTDEWTQFDAWLYGRAQLYQDNNYFSGMGAQAMNDAEIAALAQWAQEVYSRLQP